MPLPTVEPLAWWGELRHGGLMLSATALAKLVSAPLDPVPPRKLDHLRTCLMPVLAAETPSRDAVSRLLDVVLEETLGLATCWHKGAVVAATWGRKAMTGEVLKPRRLWTGASGEMLPVFVAEFGNRLGVGRGRREVARVIEWLRKAGQPIALVTNGRQWRVVYAGADFDAFVEWEAETWFEAGQASPRLEGFRRVLASPAALVAAIQESRKGQAELSQVLGERVRLAVELLIRAQARSLDAVRHEVAPRDLYVAACRIVMRLVVIMFAEARDLLPRDNPLYHRSYGLEGLRELLDRGGDAARRRHMHGAWPRLLALFRLIHCGSHHPELLVPAYGGELFAPGDAAGPEGLSRALAALETAEDVDDQVVAEMFEFLCRTKIRVRQGRSATWVTAPVDFSDLSSEYIGILYEGLLDFELHRVGDDPVLFLALGNQPALPLSRLEGLDDKALKVLVEAVKKGTKQATGEEVGADEDEADGDEDGEAVDPLAGDSETAVDEAGSELDHRKGLFERARAWGARAVRVGKLIGARGLKDPAKVEAAARALVTRLVMPGEWYLVRWGGTRKGAGTFYTRPQLAVPTVMRTLRPLAYVEPSEDGGEWVPRSPHEILGLKVCDPAMGSGSFLVAALRYLTAALHASLYANGCIRAHGRKAVITLGEGGRSKGRLSEETLPLPPDDPDFDERLLAVLKRHVVENCLYGVDLDPLAVELGRMALWVETMNRALPFGFLDHKLKVGNALVGAWFDTFQWYPFGAWEREGGDKGHKGVHVEGEAWTKAIKAKRKEAKADGRGQQAIFKATTGQTAATVHDEALAVMERLHAVPVHRSDQRARIYREEIVGSPAVGALRQAMDLWCSTWFWPNDRLNLAPMPSTLTCPGGATLTIARQLAAQWRFFHWELEFPDVFASAGGGFAAVIGNPPWDIQKPNSKEFFSNVDALYRGYTKQEALQHQRIYFAADPEIEAGWLAYNARFKAMGNWVKHVGGVELHGQGFADRAHPFRHQGSADVNTFKLFMELAVALLRPDGMLGFIVPSGLYSDKGCQGLRALLLERCSWEWLFVFENREKIFNIHRSFKFGPVIVQKGGRTERVMTAFMRHDVQEWAEAESHAIPFHEAQIARFSPRTRAIVEIRSEQDLDILSTLYADAVLLGEDGAGDWGISYACEFHMTSDSKLFPPLPDWVARGYTPAGYGRWSGPKGDLALPLYQGIMVGQYDFSKAGWVAGTGLSAEWREIGWEDKAIEPQYLIAASHANTRPFRDLRVAFRDIARSTDVRSMIASVIPGFPAGNSVPVLTVAEDGEGFATPVTLLAILNSFVYDYQARIRLGGTHLNYYVIEETALPKPTAPWLEAVQLLAPSLAMPHPVFAQHWLRPAYRHRPWKAWWALTRHERLRLRCILEALVAAAYGLTLDQFAYIVAERPADPKGFWRVDQDLPVEQRLTTLSLVAYSDLVKVGVGAFLAQHDGEGWMLPEALVVEGEPRPVRAEMGPRFFEWQLTQDLAASWRECESIAADLDGTDLLSYDVGLDSRGAVGTEQPNGSVEQLSFFGPQEV